MSANTPSTLREFHEYLEFLKGLWASLGSISVVFPLSNALLKVVPIGTWPEGGFVSFSMPLVTTTASLMSLFLVLWIFVGRHRYRAVEAWEKMSRSSVVSLFTAALCLLAYLVAHYAISNGFYFDVLGWESDDMRRILGDVFLLLCYAGFFASVTRAFLLVAMKEFLRKAVQNGV